MEDNKKRVYRFGGKTAEGDGTMRNLLGGKGANLAEMCRLNIPVPAGFTITTECCAEYYQLGGGYTEALKAEVKEAMRATEKPPVGRANMMAAAAFRTTRMKLVTMPKTEERMPCSSRTFGSWTF